MRTLMKNLIQKIDWQKVNGLIPAIVQDAETNTVLMLGYMNKESLEKTQKSKQVYFFSRTKKRLWLKGETSGNYLDLVNIKIDCDADTLLIKAIPKGPTCHKGQTSCFGDGLLTSVLTELYSLILNRKSEMPQNSYTASLFSDGLDKICQKIEEEALEVIQAAKQETKQRLVEESSDLIYHLLVLLAEKGVNLSQVFGELEKRRK